MNLHRVGVWILAVSLGLGLARPTWAQFVPAAPAASPTTAPLAQPADALASLNAAFRDTYARTRTIQLETAGPLILLNGDQLVLFRGKERRAADVIPRLYHDLKAVSHLTLAIFVTLSPAVERGGELLLEEEPILSRLESLARKARDNLEGRDFTPTQIERQRKILDASIQFLEKVLPPRQLQPKIKAEDLQEFTRRMAPEVLANAYDASRAQIDATSAQVGAWRKTLRPGEWEKLRVVVVGGQMPRKGNIAVQLFAKILNEPGEGKRIIYAEALFEEERALKLAGTHTLDRKVAIYFFDDSERMHRDLLSDAAEKYLKEFAP